MLAPDHYIYLLVHGLVLTVGIIIVQLGGVIAVSVGTSVVATAIAGWILFLFAWFEKSELQRLSVLRSFGFLNAFSGRSVSIRAEYDKRLLNVQNKIDLLGFGLRAL